ncbi:hypothetical protein PIIN_04751 [Serendipita indica DSM 11827]|uniref:Uncharacterized protein n=1 Tax=Serendipita indica (strain DSM 11827) TaxID=1109443 RepID=G4THM1_SERID|nr:hypothetical protein PIIN_04751 [Serendipita indica DSM 11827]
MLTKAQGDEVDHDSKKQNVKCIDVASALKQLHYLDCDEQASTQSQLRKAPHIMDIDITQNAN